MQSFFVCSLCHHRTFLQKVNSVKAQLVQTSDCDCKSDIANNLAFRKSTLTDGKHQRNASLSLSINGPQKLTDLSLDSDQVLSLFGVNFCLSGAIPGIIPLIWIVTPFVNPPQTGILM